MKNLKVRKSLTALALSTSLVLSSLSGCGKKEAGNDCTVREYMQSVDEFDLINPDKGETYKIIKTENVKGETDVKFVQVLTTEQLNDVNNDTWVFEDSDSYDRYFDSNKAVTSNTYLYFNALDGELVSVKYKNVNRNLFKDNEYEISYLISNITDEDDAYNYACTYLGDKDIYTREDISNLIEFIKEEKTKEATSKTLSLK